MNMGFETSNYSLKPSQLLSHTDGFVEDLNSQVQRTLVNQVFDYYCQSILKSSRAINFVKRDLGISDLSFIKQFNVGFSDRTLGLHLPDPESFEGASVRGRLQRLGLLKATGHELFRGAIVFPLKDIEGVIIGAYGFWIGYRPSHLKDAFVVWDCSKTGLFNPNALFDDNELILCKTPIEAAMLWSLGFRNVTSILSHEGSSITLPDVIQCSDIRRVEIYCCESIDEQWLCQTKRSLRDINIPFTQQSLARYVSLS
jgi:hypothetical protein